MTPEELFESLRAELAGHREERTGPLARIRAAVDAWLLAVERELVSEAASRHDLTVSAGPTPDTALHDLEAALGAVLAAVNAPPVDPSTPRATEPESPLDAPEVQRLVTEWDALEPAQMTDDLFRTYAQEFAARARDLQDRGFPASTAQSGLGRLIRKITRLVTERRVYVYGLAQKHCGAWGRLAERAREEREMLLTR